MIFSYDSTSMLAKSDRGLVGLLKARVIALLLLSIFLASTIISPVSLAAVTTYNNMPLDQRGSSYMLAKAMEYCLRSVTEIKNEDVIASQLPNDQFVSGFWYIDTEDGKRKCSNLLSQSLSVWGYSDFSEALKDWGYVSKEKTGPFGGSYIVWENSDPANKFTAAIKKRIYGGSNISLSNPDKYVYYSKILQNVCQLSEGVKLADASEAIKNEVNLSNGVYLKVTEYQDGKLVDMAYKFNSKVQGEVPTVPPGNASMSCKELAAAVSAAAGDFNRWAASHEEEAKKYDMGAGGLGKTGGGARTSCALEGVGWIVCPVAIFLAKITDKVFSVMTILLEVKPPMINARDQSYVAWQTMRNIANVAFVIAFLYIVFSQVSSFGISNYGLKRMLPKLIIAAILVNVSYWICALAVDLSNVFGYSLQAIFTGMMGESNATVNNLTGWTEVTAWLLAGGLASVGIGTVSIAAIGAGGPLAALAALLPLLVAALFAIVTVVLVLVARQALIIILIVIAPLAFVAYILPNTEGWYKKWQKFFFTLLLMFPVISVVFGGSQLAAAVVRGSTPSAIVYIVSLGIQIIPLFIVPVVLKSAGGVLNRLGGMVNNPNKGPFDRARKYTEGVRDRQQARSKLSSFNSTSKVNPWRRNQKRNARLDMEKSHKEAELKSSATAYLAKEVETNEKFRSKVADGGGQGAETRVRASAIAARQRQNKELMEARISLLEDLDPTEKLDKANQLLIDSNKEGDVTGARAATQVLLKSTGTAGKEKLHNTVREITENGALNDDVSEAIRADILESGAKGHDSAIDSWALNYGKAVMNPDGTPKLDNNDNPVLKSTSLSSYETSRGVMERLNTQELAGQAKGRLYDALDHNTVTADEAERVLEASKRGAIALDTEKREIFEDILKNTRITDKYRNQKSSAGGGSPASSQPAPQQPANSSTTPTVSTSPTPQQTPTQAPQQSTPNPALQGGTLSINHPTPQVPPTNPSYVNPPYSPPETPAQTPNTPYNTDDGDNT